MLPDRLTRSVKTSALKVCRNKAHNVSWWIASWVDRRVGRILHSVESRATYSRPNSQPPIVSKMCRHRIVAQIVTARVESPQPLRVPALSRLSGRCGMLSHMDTAGSCRGRNRITRRVRQCRVSYCGHARCEGYDASETAVVTSVGASLTTGDHHDHV